MKILITGPNGFVGKHLVQELTEHDLILANRELIGDISKYSQWSELLRGVDVVVHLAARVHIMQDHASDPLSEFRKINVEGTKKLAKACVEAGVKKLIYLSSIKVNGEGKDSDYTDDDPPAPEDDYGVSKLEAEQALRKISDQSDLAVLIIRPPLIYGDGVRGNYATLERVVKKGLPLPFKGFRAKRSLLDYQKLVQLNSSNLHSTGEKFKVCLLADKNPLTTPELVHKIASDNQVKARLFYFPPILLKLMLTIVGKKSIYQRLNTRLTCKSAK